VRQRGRAGAIQLAMRRFAPRPKVTHLAPPPATLGDEEKALWRSITTQRDFNPVGCTLLESALRMHEIGRIARETVIEKGMMVVDRNGYQRLNPAARIERDARQLFYQICKLLHVRLEFDETTRAH
jgi:phage terminase small subunit